MTTSPGGEHSLEQIIAKWIPPAMLEKVVTDQGVLGLAERKELFKPTGYAQEQIVASTVAAYGEHQGRLAYGLYRQVYARDWETANKLAKYFTHKDDRPYQNHQASLVARIPTVSAKDTNDFLQKVLGQVCLVVCRKGGGEPSLGTGFLVAPDLVLTCRHVLKCFDSLDGPMAADERLEVHFDFHQGEPATFGTALPGAIKVAPAREWHVASCAATDPDGLPAKTLVPAEHERIAAALDFVLLRLSQKVGRQPVDPGGGRRRGWIELAEDEVPRNLEEDDWIMIPQHPGGFPMRIDFGRYSASDPTATRIRYSTNTAKGTSGAPCFSYKAKKFTLVGLHNAYVGEEKEPTANQAIRFDHIAQRIRRFVDPEPAPDGHARRWSTALPGDAPRVVLGRDVFLSWLEGSMEESASRLAERVYVARADVPQAGCTFSIEMLEAEIRDSIIPRCVYGSIAQAVPETAQDFLKSLLRELQIDLQKSPPPREMPPRPGAAPSGGAAEPSAGKSMIPGEVDKLERWLSDELPAWLDEVITAHLAKEVDARSAYREAAESFRLRGVPPPAEIKEKAEAREPILVRPNAWPCAYVVLDELRVASFPPEAKRTAMNREVTSLVAALVKGKGDAAARPGLQRLRWMFLGYLPDFLGVAQNDEDGATVEGLDPAAISAQDVLEVFRRMSKANLDVVGEALPQIMAAQIVKLVRGQLANLRESVNEMAAEQLKQSTN